MDTVAVISMCVSKSISDCVHGSPVDLPSVPKHVGGSTVLTESSTSDVVESVDGFK